MDNFLESQPKKKQKVQHNVVPIPSIPPLPIPNIPNIAIHQSLNVQPPLPPLPPFGATTNNQSNDHLLTPSPPNNMLRFNTFNAPISAIKHNANSSKKQKIQKILGFDQKRRTKNDEKE